MRRPEVGGPNAGRSLDGIRAASEVVADIAGKPPVQFAVGIAVVAELVPFVCHSPDETRPAVGVTPEHKESGMDTLPAQDVEDTRCRIGVGTVVERDAHHLFIPWQTGEDGPEQDAVAVPGAVRRKPRDDQSGSGRADHTAMATRPITLW